MLTSIRKINTTMTPISSAVFRRPQSYWVFLPQFLFSTLNSEITTHQDPNLTLQIFKDHGFTDTQIADIIRRAPMTSSIRNEAVSNIMRYLREGLCLSQPDLVKLVTLHPHMFQSKLDNAIIPSVTYLDSTLATRAQVVQSVMRTPWLLRSSHTNVSTNIEMLKEFGVPISTIAKLLVYSARNLLRSSERLREILNDVISSGFDPSKKMFVYALDVKGSQSRSTWEKKVEVYSNFGWSVEETQLAFQKLPPLFKRSEETIKKQLMFLMGTLKMSAKDVLTYPKVMTVSLERTLIPRCCVLNVLMGRGLVKKDIKMPGALCKSADSFSKDYVEKYKDDVPEVLEAYHGKMEFLGFDHQR